MSHIDWTRRSRGETLRRNPIRRDPGGQAVFDTIRYEVRDCIGRLTLNRPDRLNALTDAAYLEIQQALRLAKEDPELRLLLLTGSGRAFCVGQDLQQRRRDPDAAPPDLGATLDANVNPIIRLISSLEIPVLCAVNGVAAGFGANLAFACDVVVARHSSRFVEAFTRIGLVPDGGGTWHLPQLIGRARALGMIYTADPVDALTAEAWGLIWRAIPDGEFEASVEELAAQLARSPSKALRASKALVSSPAESLDMHLERERSIQQELGRSDDYHEGVAAFLEKRPPNFNR